jgi:hypothetical protein
MAHKKNNCARVKVIRRKIFAINTTTPKRLQENFSNDEIKITRVFFYIKSEVDEKLLERKSDNDESTFSFLAIHFFSL